MDNMNSGSQDVSEPVSRLSSPFQPGTPERYDYEEEERPHVRVGGRKSKLAVIQSRHVANLLRDVHPGLSFPVLALSTLGDNVPNRPLYSFGGKALWTKELEVLLLHHVHGFDQLDMIVHSLKDMPTELPEGCELGAIPMRHDPRDAVCMRQGSPHTHLGDLPDGSVVGTSSIRRSAQLKRKFPNLRFESVRGNVQTRLSKCDDLEQPYEAIILAVAGLERLGLADRITSFLDAPDMYYAVGQGALGIEIRAGDERVKKLVSRIDHHPSRMRCISERSLMRTLEGGCSVPIGVKSEFEAESSMLSLTGIVVSVDGKEAVEGSVAGECFCDEDANQIGKDLAADLIAKGASKILNEIHLDRID